MTNAVRRDARTSGLSSHAWIARYMPIPFADHGRSFEAVDCRGLVLLILEHERGQRVPEPEDLYRATTRRDAPALAGFVREEMRRWRLVEADADGGYSPFSVLLFAVLDLPTHVGLSLGARDFIHAQHPTGVRVSNLDEAEPGEARWGARLKGAFEYVG